MDCLSSGSPYQASRACRKWLPRLLTVSIALTINLFLFNLMPYLLHGTDEKPGMAQVVSQINVIRLKQSESPVKRTAEKPPEPPPEPKAPKPLSTKPAPTKLTLPFSINPRLPAGPNTLSLPVLPAATIDTAGLQDIFSIGDLDSPLMVMVRIPPIYPLSAKHRGTEGWVRVRFIVHEDGHVDNVTVEESEPRDIFDASVIRSVSGWRFKAGMIGGLAVKAWAETTVRFKLD
jgi:protein TonB